MTTADTSTALAERRHCGDGLLPLEMAVADYDRTRPIIDGRVKPKDIALKVEARWIGDFCRRPVYEEYDAAEMSFSWYVAARDRGEPVIALPVFLLRMAVLGYVYVRADSPITKPSELIGKRIGARGYRQTVNLWVRGLFQEFYGLAPTQVTWITAGEEDAGYVPPRDVKIEIRPGAVALDDLKSGAVDAVVTTSVPKPVVNGEPWIRRLFPDCQAEMHALARRTGILPITHVLVMKKQLAEEQPWVAENLYAMFLESQRLADEPLQLDSKRLSLMDASFIFEQQRTAYGQTPYSHGLRDNRRTVETFARYAHQQGYTSRVLPVEGLFAPATLAL
jgi:4,5-dihydroxyphthalate decarboxylase